MNEEPEFKTYLFEYEFEGQRWAIAMKAASQEEAVRRIRSLSSQAIYIGEQVFSIWTPFGFHWLGRLISYIWCLFK